MSQATFQHVFSELESLYASAGKHVTVDVKAGRLSIEAPGVSVQNLAELFAHVLQADDFVPDWIPAGIRLQQLLLIRESSTGTFSLSLSVVAEDAHWEVFDGFTIEGGSIDVEYNASGLWGRLSGSAKFDGLELIVTAELPDQILTARLHSSDDGGDGFLRTNGLLAPSSGDRHPGTSAQLIDLSVYAALRTHHFVLHAEASNVIDVHPFVLEHFSAELHVGSQSEGQLWADIIFDLDASTKIHVQTYGRIDAQGWAFSGSVDFEPGLTLQHMTDGLVQLMGHSSTKFTLPGVAGNVNILSLSLSFETASKDVAFSCHLDWPDDDVDVHITLHHRDRHFTARGRLTIGHLHFDLVFDQSAGNTALVGVFAADGGVSLTLADLLGALKAKAGTLGQLANDFSFTLLDATLAYESGSKLLLAADMDLGVDLSGLGSLPLVGSMLPPGEAMRLTFRPIVSSAWTSAELQPVRQALPDEIPPLPDTLKSGATIDAQLQLGKGKRIDLPMISVPADSATPPNTGQAQVQPANQQNATALVDDNPDDINWHEVNRKFGPVHVGQVGVKFDAGSREVTVLLGGSISIAGLELSLMGFGARYNLNDQHLDVTLHGMGLDLHRGPVEIAGAFTHDNGEFAGQAVLRTPAFAVTVRGAFSMVSGSPSMFLYGTLDYPLGGPPFFFVEGLALGFGYNRRFIPPTVDEIDRFPLVTDAMGKSASPTTLDQQLARLHEAVPPALGHYFVAAGVKFTSFKLLDSFALVVVSFGEHVEFDLIGTSTYQTPPGDLGSVPPMARAELNLVARVVPDTGEVMVVGQLSSTSYVYNPLCHIYGGFAFASWFKGDHEGDFVVSVGGYHPHFKPPGHYPHPPRIGLRFQVNPDIYIKGEGYFALTPSAFMAGALIEASATIGSASAMFRMALDFLIGWEPYHYDASLTIDVAARWHCFHTDAHIELYVFGPPFAGYGKVHWTVFSFDVEFGSSRSLWPIPISFDRFKQAFLPDAKKACSIRVAKGLVDTLDIKDANGDELTVWNINPKHLRLETSSVIPEGKGLGIASMGQASLSGTEQTVSITRDNNPANADFTISALPTKAFPSALWGKSIERKTNDKPVRAVAGYSIVPRERVKAHQTHPVKRRDLDYAAPIKHHAWQSGFSLAYGSTQLSRDTGPSALGDNDDKRWDDLPWDKIKVRAAQGGLG